MSVVTRGHVQSIVRPNSRHKYSLGVQVERRWRASRCFSRLLTFSGVFRLEPRDPRG